MLRIWRQWLNSTANSSLENNIQLKHLLPLAGVTQMRRIQGNVLVVKQREKVKYIYFIRSGLFKVMKEVNFIKQLEGNRSNNIEDYYQTPSQQDLANHNVKSRLLEVDQLGKFNSFGDRNFPPPKYTQCFEPFTVISMIPSEVYFIERDVLLQLLPTNYSLQLKSFPDEFQLRKRYYEQKSWKAFKSGVFKTLLNTDTHKNVLSHRVSYGSPKKRVSYGSPKSSHPFKLPNISKSKFSKSKHYIFGNSKNRIKSV